MNERQAQELGLLRTRYLDLEFLEDGLWVRIARYPVPGDLWTMGEIEVVCQIPDSVAQAPYGFYVPRALALKNGATIQSYADGTTPFEGEWGKFSWQTTWQPAADIHSGTNMLDFVTSFAARLREGA
jgi:Prokaryotic E2 family E